jgi:hypothetical protein
VLVLLLIDAASELVRSLSLIACSRFRNEIAGRARDPHSD